MWVEAGPAADSRPAQLSGRAAMEAICLEVFPAADPPPRKRGDENYPGCKPLKIHKIGKSSTPRRPLPGRTPPRADPRIAGEPDGGGAGRAGGASLPSEALAGAGLGQGFADLEAEIVHRRLLAHRKILALGLALGLLRRARDVDRHVRLDLGMQVHRVLVQAERLDRLRQRDLVAMD